MKTLDFFQCAYVINLPERIDRRVATEKELKNVGMCFAAGKLEFFPAIRPDSAADFPSIGARGCFMSHLQVLKMAREQGLANVLIMEDDVLMSRDFNTYEASLIQQLSQTEWGIAYFGYPIKLSTPVTGQFVPLTESIHTAHFYSVNGTYFDRLITYLDAVQQRPSGHPEGGSMHLDGAYNLFRQNNPDIPVFRASPSLVAQRSTRSDIFPNAWYETTPVLSQLLGIARSAKTFVRSRQADLG